MRKKNQIQRVEIVIVPVRGQPRVYALDALTLEKALCRKKQKAAA
jgi:hypothetical protein